jgi:hypothetical protein
MSHGLHNASSLITHYASPEVFGGGERDRTDDPLLAKQVLSQLSYTPLWRLRHWKLDKSLVRARRALHPSSFPSLVSSFCARFASAGGSGWS